MGLSVRRRSGFWWAGRSFNKLEIISSPFNTHFYYVAGYTTRGNSSAFQSPVKRFSLLEQSKLACDTTDCSRSNPMPTVNRV